MALMDHLKWWVFPGINLHARERYRRVPKEFDFANGRREQLLDAGFGNGMLSWQAWRRGFRVVGVSLKKREVLGATRWFNGKLGLSPDEVCFVEHNLYDTTGIRSQYGQFDQIVCAEVIEHIRDDAGICAAFHELLKPGGVLHLTTPNAEHPYNASFPLDLDEKGGHVRAGYTRTSLEDLLLPIGFEVESFYGFGGPLRQWFNGHIKETQRRFGPWAGVPLFLAALPFLPFDSARPEVPCTWYMRVRKRIDGGSAC